MADNTPTSADALLNTAPGQARKTSEEIIKDYDLLQKVIPHFDRHLVFPLLEFRSSQETETAEEMTKTKYELLKPTNMTDYVANLWQEIHQADEIPEEFVKKREEVLQRLQLYQEESSKIIELLEDKEVVDRLRSDKIANLQFLKEQHGV
jgi:translation initiation factor 3 subunit E